MSLSSLFENKDFVTGNEICSTNREYFETVYDQAILPNIIS
jgi:hypothetical protein